MLWIVFRILSLLLFQESDEKRGYLTLQILAILFMIEAALGNLIDMQLSLAQETSRGYKTLKKMLLWILLGCTAGNFTAMIYFVITQENSNNGSLTGPH